MSGAWISILRGADGCYYTGITRRSVEERVSEHQQGLLPGCYMDRRRPVELVFSEFYEGADEAAAAERRIKGWSRTKKEAYMRGPAPTWPQRFPHKRDRKEIAPPKQKTPELALRGCFVQVDRKTRSEVALDADAAVEAARIAGIGRE